MIPTFSLAALCCIPSHNPDQREKERKIMKRPALHTLSESWAATFPDAAHLDERAQDRIRQFRVIRSVV
jgi:hypothetical protein